MQKKKPMLSLMSWLMLTVFTVTSGLPSVTYAAFGGSKASSVSSTRSSAVSKSPPSRISDSGRPGTNYGSGASANFYRSTPSSPEKPSLQVNQRMATATVPAPATPQATGAKAFGNVPAYAPNAGSSIRAARAQQLSGASTTTAAVGSMQSPASSKNTPDVMKTVTRPDATRTAGVTVTPVKKEAIPPTFTAAKIPATADRKYYDDANDRFSRNYGWSRPQNVTIINRHYDGFRGDFMWSMPSALGATLSAAQLATNLAILHQMSKTPGYTQWMLEAEREAATNAQLRADLDRMKTQLADYDRNVAAGTVTPAPIPTEVAAAALAPEVAKQYASEKVPLVVFSGTTGNVYDAATNQLKSHAEDVQIVNKNSAGSVENIDAILKGETDAAFVQSNILDRVVALIPSAADKIAMHQVMYTEAVQIITQNGPKKLTGFDENTTVIVGPKGSSSEITWRQMTEANKDKYSKVKIMNFDYRTPDDLLNKLKIEKNSVFLFTAGLNSGMLKRAEERASADGFKLVQINESFDNVAVTDKSGQKQLIFSEAEIPSNIYPNLQKGWFFGHDVKTLTVDAVFVLSSNWVEKHGVSAGEEVLATIADTQPELEKMVNGLGH